MSTNFSINEDRFLKDVRDDFIQSMSCFSALNRLHQHFDYQTEDMERLYLYESAMLVNAALVPLAQLFFLSHYIPYPLKNNNYDDLKKDFIKFVKPYGDMRRDCGVSVMIRRGSSP